MVVVVAGSVLVVEDEGTPVVVVLEDAEAVATQQAVTLFGATSYGMSVETSGVSVSVKAATSIDAGFPIQAAGKAMENC